MDSKHTSQSISSAFGVSHGAGKGDKTRVRDVANYRRNFEEIRFPRSKCCNAPVTEALKLTGPTVEQSTRVFECDKCTRVCDLL